MSEVEPNLQKSEIAKKEEAILKFWQDNNIFEKTLNKEASAGEYVFYDGPPFATGLPHYGHILASAIKDAIPRYKTMKGFSVPRRWGWDCHGLPIENIAEKDLKISGKKQIEEIGVKKFNEHARSKVLEYIHDWKRTVERIGRWVDFDGSYKTMDNTYMESVWWTIKQVHEKGLLYEGTRVLPYCPRCETPIANSEIAMDNSYKDIKDISVYVKFALVDEPETYFLVWTTTPWTLPGNVALAVGPEIVYVKVKAGETTYILAKNLYEKLISKFGDSVIQEEFLGKDLIGKKYKALFDYYTDDKNLKNSENGWQVYGAEFVTVEDGTGIVHIAPAFGEDDMALAKKEKLPIIWHVDGTGRFKPELREFAGLLVKPKDDTVDSPVGHMITDIEIIRYLENNKILFAKEKITHSYPHCFRCETPLFYYAIPSWFIDIQKVKSKILDLNEKKINWIPDHLKRGRFHNSVASAPDWNISRNRYWATPLPIWKCSLCKEMKIIGSVEELSKARKNSGNKYWAMRHGQAESNIEDKISTDPTAPDHLTDKGKEQVKESAQKLKSEKINLIISSDFVRTKETAQIVAEELGLNSADIISDKRLREIENSHFQGKTWREYNEAFGERINRLHNHLSTGGENYNDVRQRIMSVFYSIDKEYEGKNILIVSHGLPLFMLQATVNFLTDGEIVNAPKRAGDFANAEVREINFSPVPHNDNYELDLHRPYIDDFQLSCPDPKCEGKMNRITEVVDCWLESGSMPFASNHYPLSKQNKFDPILAKGFPAQFVAEYIAQTRTWFYYMLAISTILFDSTPFENVVTTGTILAEDGQKMSKSKGNYPDPWLVFDKYGVDALRLYLLSTPVMRAEDLNFSEKGVAEIGRKIVMRLLNVLSFYQLYVTDKQERVVDINKTVNVLDHWILLRLQETVKSVEQSLDRYETDRAIRPIDDFIEDLSTWYLRRSRDRFKEEGSDKDFVVAVTRHILLEISKVLAPLAPFVSEMIYQELKNDQDVLSIHLTAWPEYNSVGLSEIDGNKVLENMKEVRRLVSLGLEFRQAMKVKVRQPLAELKVKSNLLAGQSEYIQLVGDELNVKEISFGQKIEDEVWLDSEINEQLLAEGLIRELIRQIQERRKQLGLNPKQQIELTVESDDVGQAIMEQFEKDFLLGTNTKKVIYEKVSDGESLEVNERLFKVKIVVV